MIKFYILLSVLILTLLSCDPAYEIEWKVINNTDKNISIYLKTWQDSIEQFNSLSPHLTLFLLNEPNFGTVKSCIEDTKFTPFQKLRILNSKGDSIKKDISLIKNWKVRNIKDEIAEYTLKINADDF